MEVAGWAEVGIEVVGWAVPVGLKVGVADVGFEEIV